MRAQDKEGNDKSDNVANMGTNAVQPGVRKIARHYQQREKDYIKVAKSTVDIIVSTMRAYSEIQEEERKGKKMQQQLGIISKEVVPRRMFYAEEGKAKTLEWKSFQDIPQKGRKSLMRRGI